MRTLSVCILLACAACTSPASTPDIQRSTVVLWHTLTGARELALMSLVDQWNSGGQRSRVAIERKQTQGFHTTLKAGSGNNALPHIILASAAQIAAYDAAGSLSDLALLLDPASGGWTDEDRNDLHPYMLTAGRSAGGRLVAVPQGGNLQVMVYNRDLLRSLNLNLLQPPRDWEPFTDSCRRVSDAARGLVCIAVESSMQSLEAWSIAHGAAVVVRNPVGGGVQFGLDSVNGRGGLQRLRSYVQDGLASGGLEPQQAREDFAFERALYAFESSQRLPALRELVRARGAFEWSVASLPTATSTQRERVPFQGLMWSVPVSSASTQAAARAFIKWATATEQTAAYATRTGELPSRRSAVAQIAAQPRTRDVTPELLEAWRNLAPAAAAAPMFAGAGCGEDELLAGMLLVEEGSRPIEDALQQMRGAIQPFLNKECATTR